jgi:CHAD domain-containing protein
MLTDESSDEDYHHARILAKRCRYATEAARTAIGGRGASFHAALVHLQDELGDYHDSVVADAWLQDTAHEIPDAGVVAGELIGIERLGRRCFREDWPSLWKATRSDKLRKWL